MSNPDLLQAISTAIYESVVETQQGRSTYLTEKFRSIVWAEKQEGFIKYLKQKLSQLIDSDKNKQDVYAVVELYLKHIYTADFLTSQQFIVLKQAIDRLIQSQQNDQIRGALSNVAESNGFQPQASKALANQGIDDSAIVPASIPSSPVATSVQESGIAILLLDAENLKLDAKDVKIQAFLQHCCTYPITVKIAFANWKNQGNWDEKFHQLNYQMIHVPPGQN